MVVGKGGRVPKSSTPGNLPSCEVSLNLNHRRPGIRSWAERHHFAIGLALSLVGLAAVGTIHFLGAKGSFATMIGALAGFALLFGEGYRRNRGAIFPPSEINQQNRWKYLVLAAALWGALFLLWRFRVRLFAR
jgi:hypothetical protein